jgi:hypothetical protein
MKLSKNCASGFRKTNSSWPKRRDYSVFGRQVPPVKNGVAWGERFVPEGLRFSAQ